MTRIIILAENHEFDISTVPRPPPDVISGPCHLLSLPVEILALIVEWVVFGHEGSKRPSIQPANWKRMHRLALTCRLMYELVNDELLWQRLNDAYLVGFHVPLPKGELTPREALIHKYKAKYCDDIITLRGNGTCTVNIADTDMDWTVLIALAQERGAILQHLEANNIHDEMVCVGVRSPEIVFVFVDGTILHKFSSKHTSRLKVPSDSRPVGMRFLEIGCFVWTAHGDVFFWSKIDSIEPEGLQIPTKLASLNMVKDKVIDIFTDPENNNYTGDNPAVNKYVVIKCETISYKASYAMLILLMMEIHMSDEEIHRAIEIVGHAPNT